MNAKSEVTELIEQILVHGGTIYSIAHCLGKQYNQVKRMHDNGRCQPNEYRRLENILKNLVANHMAEQIDSRETQGSATHGPLLAE